MIAGVVTAKNPREALEKIKASNFDLYEIRLDSFWEFEGLEVLGEYSKRLIFTPRRKEEGGIRPLDDGTRLRLYRRVMALKPAYVDVEFGSKIASEVIELAREKSVRVVLSHHDFKGTPGFGKLLDLLKEMEELEPGIIKIVTTANSVLDNLRVLRLYEYAENLIAFCMGPLGRVSRVFSAQLAPFTYAPVDGEVAPGQFPAEELERLRVMLFG
ncbi:3-dehydroquinate dehydratase I [Thermococcus sp. 2319x1]|uniref:3-dehydroquinate dehydratase n=1 Tax=Thermococcus sp. 2319x1 TaxID=1674923 RepID=UPI00073A9ECD|nr:3-dehydroquinate dehydratase [Thermococcus sp. 2319x1]ALV62715.1 3-dehydroquinate dehydratase I [Thermococcus sp. 2319x1]